MKDHYPNRTVIHAVYPGHIDPIHVHVVKINGVWFEVSSIEYQWDYIYGNILEVLR